MQWPRLGVPVEKISKEQFGQASLWAPWKGISKNLKPSLLVLLITNEYPTFGFKISIGMCYERETKTSCWEGSVQVIACAMETTRMCNGNYPYHKFVPA